MNNDFKEYDLEEKNTNKDKFFNVLAYIPFLNIFILVSKGHEINENNKKFFNQGIAIFLLYMVGFIVLSIISFSISFLFTIIYFLGVIFFGTKAYNDLYVEISFLENIITSFLKTKEDKKTKKDDENPL
ncbi:hypothetical protein H3C61_04225 [Candidatus Gracilibacteria bacterium]|nr:hypothetical protein [Candidatus Gracilibacteria bacterium]